MSLKVPYFLLMDTWPELRSFEVTKMMGAQRDAHLELAVLNKYRADVRVNLGMLEGAREDYASSIKQLTMAEDAGEISKEGTFCISTLQRDDGEMQYCVYIPAPGDL